MNLNTMLAAAIAKGALRVTRGPVAALRHDVAGLKREVADLKRLLRAVKKDACRCSVQAPAAVAEAAQPSRIRPTGPMVLKLRKRLGLTQSELAKLIGVSSLTVSKWEGAPGRIMLRTRTLEALGQVRGVSKKAAKKMLAGR
jgi:hypothetical protein